MPSIVKSLRLVADPTRIRILLLLKQVELSVAELQEILSMGQSRISTQLSQLKQIGLIADRRSGKHMMYALNALSDASPPAIRALIEVVELAASEVPEVEVDRSALELILHKRQNKTRAYFDELAGKFGRYYCPGRSWKGLGEMLLKILPPMVIADLGAGEGTFSQLLAQRAERVIAIDNAEKMVDFGATLAKQNGCENLEYRFGDIMDPPIDDACVDIAFFSQALHHAINPQRAVQSAFRILKPGGRIVILDLLKHNFEEAREVYADVWLGFSEREILEFLRKAGFVHPDISLVHKEKQSPHFQTLLAIAQRPSQ